MPEPKLVLPPVERTPLLVLRFSPAASPRLQRLVEERLHQGGLVTLDRSVVYSSTSSSSSSQKQQTVLILTVRQQTLEEHAERIHLIKQTTVDNNNDNSTASSSSNITMDHFTVQHRLRFCDTSLPHRDMHGLFTASEWSLLAYWILDAITVLSQPQPAPPNNKLEEDSELAEVLDVEYWADTHVHFVNEENITMSLRESLRQHHGGGQQQSACLRHVLQKYGLVDAVAVVHLPKLRHQIVQRTWWPWNSLRPPVHEIQSYHGCEIAFYFAWMGMLTTWLVFPGIWGLLFYLWRLYRHDNVDEDEFLPFYGLIQFFWAILFLRFWDRQENRLAFQWGTYSLSPYQRQRFVATRPEFRGYLRRSPVTGQRETYYPPFRRRLKYVVSAIVTTTLLSVAFVIMILSLNLQGYIRPQSNPSRWDDEHPHPFHWRSLAVLAEEGQIFDAGATASSSSFWCCSFIPVVLHVICISTLNNIYRIVAEKLTFWENHETHASHYNSLVLKRFLFEAFDCYMSLFYLAFYERNVERLRMELMAVFQIDTVRRLLLECIVPLSYQRWVRLRNYYNNKQQRHDKNDNDDVTASSSSSRDDNNTMMIPTVPQILADLDKDSYEQFDDFMEIVIQLGYVTLFASAYPLASLVSVAANWVEIRADCYKVSHLCQRAVPCRSSGLGMWRDLMACVIWMSALTNCLIAGFTSDQLMHYLPSFYIQDDKTGYTDMGHEKSWIVVFVIFGLERLLILGGLLIHAIVPAVPEDVSDQLERQHYARMLGHDEVKLVNNGTKTVQRKTRKRKQKRL